MEKRYIELNCPHCGEQLNVREEYRGRTGKCKHCGQSFTVPDSPDAEVFTGNPGMVTGITVDDIAPRAATPPPRTPDSVSAQGTGKRNSLIALIAVLLLAGLASAWYVLSNVEREPRVFLTSGDRYYFYDLCPRAVSLGLTKDSPTYRESVALEKGYTPVPPELRDTDVQAERAERARLQQEANAAQAEYDRMQREEAEEYARQQAEWAYEQERQRVLANFLERHRQYIRAAILGTLLDRGESTSNTRFGEFSVSQTDTNSYRFDVEVDTKGDGRKIEWYYVEIMVLPNGSVHTVSVDIKDVTPPTTPRRKSVIRY
ncbi:MAG: hypothetical protein GC168_10125 [Candidatus Hydrogenedens sp.]|nr:hypothetical protein [Candidatus Hydrogenedens sp.]